MDTQSETSIHTSEQTQLPKRTTAADWGQGAMSSLLACADIGTGCKEIKYRCRLVDQLKHGLSLKFES